MDLKFEKIIFRLWIYNQRIHSDFQIACPLPNLTIKWPFIGSGRNGRDDWKRKYLDYEYYGITGYGVSRPGIQN